MSWLRVEGAFPYHHKVLTAGERLGPSGAGRVLAVWLVGTTYSVEHLTDGHVPRSVLMDRRYDRRPAEVLAAMVQARLLREVDGGYQFHDFHDYNPSGQAVKEKRERERARKRTARGLDADTSPSPRGLRDLSARTEHGQTAESAALTRAPDRARSEPDPETQNEMPRSARSMPRPLRMLTFQAVRPHLLAAAHAALDARPDATEADLADAVTSAAASCRAVYDGRAVSTILDAVRGERAKRAG